MKKIMIVLAFGAALLGAPSAWAQPTLDFDAPGGSGSIAYAGSSGDVVGTGIGITSVTGESTPLNNLVNLAISGGSVNFSSGAFISESTQSGQTIWNFSGGGTVTLTGGMSTPSLASGTTLLSGTIASVTVIETSTGYSVSIAAFYNTVNTALSGHYGVSDPTWGGTMNIGFMASPNGSGGFTTSNGGFVGSGDVTTTAAPEPSSLAIAGIGALSLIGYGLRRRKALGA
jgi:PEP-CTERM motif